MDASAVPMYSLVLQNSRGMDASAVAMCSLVLHVIIVHC